MELRREQRERERERAERERDEKEQSMICELSSLKDSCSCFETFLNLTSTMTLSILLEKVRGQDS